MSTALVHVADSPSEDDIQSTIDLMRGMNMAHPQIVEALTQDFGLEPDDAESAMQGAGANPFAGGQTAESMAIPPVVGDMVEYDVLSPGGDDGRMGMKTYTGKVMAVNEDGVHVLDDVDEEINVVTSAVRNLTSIKVDNQLVSCAARHGLPSVWPGQIVESAGWTGRVSKLHPVAFGWNVDVDWDKEQTTIAADCLTVVGWLVQADSATDSADDVAGPSDPLDDEGNRDEMGSGDAPAVGEERADDEGFDPDMVEEIVARRRQADVATEVADQSDGPTDPLDDEGNRDIIPDTGGQPTDVRRDDIEPPDAATAFLKSLLAYDDLEKVEYRFGGPEDDEWIEAEFLEEFEDGSLLLEEPGGGESFQLDADKVRKKQGSKFAEDDKCSTCGGSGDDPTDPKQFPRPCPDCDGSGKKKEADADPQEQIDPYARVPDGGANELKDEADDMNDELENAADYTFPYEG